MKIFVYKSQVKGRLSIPSSKSMTIRALICAALSKGTSEILSPLVSEDTDAAAEVLRQMGLTIRKEIGIWRVTGGNLQASIYDIFCGESAATLRFMTAVCALVPGRHSLVVGPSLSKRPVGPLVEALKKLDINVSATGDGTPPVTIEGGAIKGEVTELPGDISSQFISALLFIAPFTPREMTIQLTSPLLSKPYVDMTLWCLKQFGINVRVSPDGFVVRRQVYRPTRLVIEGDWSSAAYLLALGAAAGSVEVYNLNAESIQGDRAILNYLRKMGANVWVDKDSINVSRGKLQAIPVYLEDCIDLLPIMAVLAALAEGTSEITGIERARAKESDRVKAVEENLKRLGIEVAVTPDRLLITGPVESPCKPVVLDSYGDHRIAMAFGVLGAAIGGVTISGAESVAKTFPAFWEMMRKVGVRMETHAE
jgi:3-phosphoshikimate 1-carboxyvinyltransferase